MSQVSTGNMADGIKDAWSPIICSNKLPSFHTWSSRRLRWIWDQLCNICCIFSWCAGLGEQPATKMESRQILAVVGFLHKTFLRYARLVRLSYQQTVCHDPHVFVFSFCSFPGLIWWSCHSLLILCCLYLSLGSFHVSPLIPCVKFHTAGKSNPDWLLHVTLNGAIPIFSSK